MACAATARVDKHFRSYNTALAVLKPLVYIASMVEADVISYIYAHRQTESTTGYFSCDPSPAPAVSELVPLLLQRPLDSFLRKHALGRLASIPASTLEQLLLPWLQGADRTIFPILSGLLRELAILNPALAGLCKALPEKGGLEAAGADVFAFTPLLYLRREVLPDAALHAAWAEMFAKNIQAHRKLPPPDEIDLSPLYSSEHLPIRKAISLQEVLLGEKTSAEAAEEALPGAEEVAELALERLKQVGALAGTEQRHVASLSPIALLLPWKLDICVDDAPNRYTLKGQATTYGRGLSLPQARASCRMEMVERFSAYLSIRDGLVLDRPEEMPLLRGRREKLLEMGHGAVNPDDFYIEAPYAGEELVWVCGQRVERRRALDSASYSKVWVPLQMVGLFSNCAEIDLCSAPGSTGIGAGSSMEQAKLAALTEIIERDAESTTLYKKSRCFRINPDSAPDETLRGLLLDYMALGINVQFMDMTGPLGVPCYQAFVIGPKGSVHRGHGASLCGARALVSALTETPYPYPGGGASGPMLRKLPEIGVDSLPDYSRGTYKTDLALLEALLCANGTPPVYVNLTRTGLDFPVVRALVPGMCPSADFDEFSRVPVKLYMDFLAS